uniref:Uncharacterized protein n=1 Tax=Aegilops tauschii subsp. strangulata TaxID=200361 RepID=A0A453CQR5_AEGTS
MYTPRARGVNHYIKGRHAPVEEHHKLESREHLHSNRHCLAFLCDFDRGVDHELPATGHRVPAAGPGGLPAAGVRRSAACCRQLLPAAGPAAGTGGQRRRLLERMVRPLDRQDYPLLFLF